MIDTIKLFDTHTHFDEEVYQDTRKQWALDAYQIGVEHLTLIGYVSALWRRLLNCHHELSELALQQQSPNCYAILGLHPVYIEQHTLEDLLLLEDFLQRKPIVAVGEIGLDRFIKGQLTDALWEKQQLFFSEQLKLANYYHLPVVLHVRKAYAETIACLKLAHFNEGGIAHAFGGGIEEAKTLVNLGFKLGVTGMITRPNAPKLTEIVKKIGIEHLVIETDCPDMTPWNKRLENAPIPLNQPAYLPEVFDAVCQILEAHSPEQQLKLAKTLMQNSKQALQLTDSVD